MATKKELKRALGKHRSWETTEGAARAPHRSMMKAMGLTDENIKAPGFLEIITAKEIYLPLLLFICLVIITIFFRKIFYKNK